jgi:hypothetical protein
MPNITPHAINTELVDAIKAEATRLTVLSPDDDRPKAQGFPVHALPNVMQWMAGNLHDTLGFPIDYTAAAMLFTLSTAIGTSLRIHAKRGWTEPATVWLALVGRPGATKTHPLTMMLGPLNARDREHARRYAEAMRDHEQAKRAAQGDKSAEVPVEPQCEQHVVGDSTPEALVEALSRNPRGLGLYRDELAGWVADFGRYNKGGDVQVMLSIWSAQPLRVNRVKNKRPLFVERPFVSVCGTIQPGVLGKLVADGRDTNGFVDRILFAYPETQEMPAWSEEECDERITSNWQTLVERVLNIPPPDDGADPLTLPLSPDAKRLWKAHHAKLKAEIDALNNDGDEARAQHRTKVVSYMLRLALVHAVATWAESNAFEMPAQVEEASLAAAIAMADYFITTADKVLFTLHDSTPVDRLSGSARTLFDALPNEFRTGEAVVKAEQADLSPRTAKRLLNKWTKERLLSRDGQGRYSKRFEH